jgi:hypothetical protein
LTTRSATDGTELVAVKVRKLLPRTGVTEEWVCSAAGVRPGGTPADATVRRVTSRLRAVSASVCAIRAGSTYAPDGVPGRLWGSETWTEAAYVGELLSEMATATAGTRSAVARKIHFRRRRRLK